jgi:putative ABC transport system permease protein
MRIYRFLLHLYPSSFRAAYGDEMCEIFARRRQEVSGFGVPALWASAFLEIVWNAAGVHWDILKQDIRYAVRSLNNARAFTLTAILVVALGVGANTAAFSVADFVLIRPLPFPQPDRLVRLWERLPGYGRMELSPADYRDWKRMNKSFESLGALTNQPMNMVGQGEPQRLDGALVTADVMPTLGVQPLVGRWFTAEEDRDGAPGTVLLSYRIWQTSFGGDLGVVGQTVRLDDKAYTVIGIMPRDFHFPSRDIDLWRPIQFQQDAFEDRNNNYLQAVGRLRPGVSLEQARAEMAVITDQLKRQYPKENGRVDANLYLLQNDLSPQSRLLVLALAGAAACVLLIACANLMNLLLARSLMRQKELAVRTAVGAGWKRLLRQMLTESMLLAFAGGVAGVLLAMVAVPLLARLVPYSLPLAQSPKVDLRVLGFSALVAIVTGIGFGLLPALRSCRNVDLGGLRESARSGGGSKERLRGALVVTEVMASVVLLIAAGLLMRALWRLQSTDPGFRADGVITLRTALPTPKYEKTAARVQFYNRVLSEVRQLPTATSAAYISFLPMVMRGGIWPVGVDGDTVLDRSEQHTASARFVTPEFFSAMGIPLLRGRDVSESDTIDQPFVAVVSQSFVNRYWPGQEALGRHFSFGGTAQAPGSDHVIVGVVGDIRVRGFEQSSEPQVYMAYKQVQDGWYPFYTPKDLVVHASSNPAALVPAIRRIIHNADPSQPVSDVQTMNDIVDDQTASRSVQVKVLGAFAAVAFLLAGIGIHGLLSFGVSQRRQEIGVRIALGAQSGHIVRMVMTQSMVLATFGIFLGLILAYGAGKTMESLLAGVKPDDPATFLISIVLCSVMAIIGSLLPILRAVRVDPMKVIRTD